MAPLVAERAVPYGDAMTTPYTFDFTIFVEPLTPKQIDALYEAGCDDALIGSRAGRWYIDFDREGTSFRAVLKSAIRDVCSVEGLVPKGVELEGLKIEVPPNM
jgi:hypothetical protein